MTDEPTLEELFADLAPVRIKFWVCQDHRGGRVEWSGDRARCLTCGRTSEDRP